MERGLRASIWAAKGHEKPNSHRYAVEWICPSCSFSNFAWRTECFRCGKVRSEFRPYITPESSNVHSCESLASQDKTESSQVHTMSLVEARNPPDLLEHKPQRQGLSTSRWAPRDYQSTHKRADFRQVWTRTVTVDTDTSAPVEYRDLTTPQQVDLGLPYEVQHYILAMIQRILEEGCYAFASRWSSDTLQKNNWTCPEAVELSAWKKFLPTAVPKGAVVLIPYYSLEEALTDAVRIRNAAVHRHLCDNGEIRRMASHAQDLMLMFSDVTRQSKFHRLEAELNDWDSATQNDQHSKKDRLVAALQEISERPLDDMDWTPNAVSLKEIKPDEVAQFDAQDYPIDEMEVDYL